MGSRALLLALCALAVATAGAGCDGPAMADERVAAGDGGKPGAPAPPPPERVLPLPLVETHVIAAAAPPRVREVGRIVERRRFALAAEVQAPVAAVRYEAGCVVTAERGEVVVQLDAEVFENDLARARARRDQARARLEWSKTSLGRIESLVEDGVRDQDALDQAEMAQKEAAALLAVAEADIVAAERAVRVSAIRLEPGLHVVDVHVEPGELAVPGRPLVEAVDVREVDLRFELAGEHLPLVAPGRALPFVVKELPGRTFEAPVVAVAPVASPTTGRFRVTLRLRNPDLVLRPGFTAVVDVGETRPGPVADGESAAEPLVRVPRRAILERHRALSCWVITPVEGSADEDGGRRWALRRASLRRSPDPADEGPDAISAWGVRPGERVVLGPGLERLTEGGEVRISDEKDPSLAPPVKR